MHDLIFAVAFVAMVATPAMVASIGGRKEYNPRPEVPSLHPAPQKSVRRAAPPVRVRAIQKIAVADHPVVTHDGPTLPIHNARGMANR